jgi:hypothetical protein
MTHLCHQFSGAPAAQVAIPCSVGTRVAWASCNASDNERCVSPAVKEAAAVKITAAVAEAVYSAA